MRRINRFLNLRFLFFFLLISSLTGLHRSLQSQEVPAETLSVKDTIQLKDTLSVPQVTDTLRKTPVPADTLKTEREVLNLSFGVGEKLKFKVRWGPIKAGNATMEIPEIIEYNGRKCFRIVSTAESSKFFSAFFKADRAVRPGF